MSSKSHAAPKLLTVSGQPSWRFQSDRVEACLTELGGQLGPVSFQLKDKKVQPYSIAPWAEEKSAAELISILRALRGDFFCLPFGGNDHPWRGEKHPVHGETANQRWHLESLQTTAGRVSLHASLQCRIRPGRVDKRVYLLPGQTAVYCQHTLSGMKGPINLGHHAMLRFPEEPGSGLVSTSPFVYGQVFPELFEIPANKGYSSLKPGAEFTSLSAVPLATGGETDLSRYPARRGFEDLVTVVSDPDLAFAWTAVVFPKPRYVWFALKNPRILRQTVFWISNGGRHYAPWNGRHMGVLGLEEVPSYFAYGLAEAVKPNPLSKKGFPTSLQLNPKEPLVVPYIMGLAAIPPGFDRVKEITPAKKDGEICLVAANGRKVTTPVQLDFLTAPAGWP
jgi:hypothetical protein